MANEKRLIDANALKDAIDEYMKKVYDCPLSEVEEYQRYSQDTKCIYIVQGLYEADEICEDAPTVDAVEVVRCKDCVFWTYEGVGSSSLKRFGRCAKWYPFGNEQHSCHDDDFCSCGERREGE